MANKPPFAKGIIKKTLRAILDPDLSAKQKGAIWVFFGNKCAFCDVEMKRNSRKGHMYHLQPGIPNHISNRVLACEICNGNEKLDRKWKEFLMEKCNHDQVTYDMRYDKIMKWVNQNGSFQLSEQQQKALDEEVVRVNGELENAVKRLRALK